MTCRHEKCIIVEHIAGYSWKQVCVACGLYRGMYAELKEQRFISTSDWGVNDREAD